MHIFRLILDPICIFYEKTQYLNLIYAEVFLGILKVKVFISIVVLFSNRIMRFMIHLMNPFSKRL